MLRGSIISMIYNKTMVLAVTSIGESAPVTLMSADIERIAAGTRYIHDVWACIIEIPIALWLLWGELGVASIAPIVVALSMINPLYSLIPSDCSNFCSLLNVGRRHISIDT